jgi:hypothetical protein
LLPTPGKNKRRLSQSERADDAEPDRQSAAQRDGPAMDLAMSWLIEQSPSHRLTANDEPKEPCDQGAW